MEIPKLNTGEDLGTQVAQASSLNNNLEIPDDMKDLFDISKNMEGVIPRLPQIKIKHSAQMFELPDESKTENFEGVILDQYSANAWWEKDISESGGNAIPECFSMDAVTPSNNCINKQNDICEDCNQNQFGSDRKGGKGKDCKNMKRLHVLMEGSLLPRRLTVPPTSIKAFELYMTGLVDRGLPYPCVVTNFTLVKKESGGFEYAECRFSNLRVLNKTEIASIGNFIKQYRESARQQEITQEEYVSSQDEQTVGDNEFTENSDVSDDDIPF